MPREDEIIAFVGECREAAQKAVGDCIEGRPDMDPDEVAEFIANDDLDATRFVLSVLEGYRE